MALTVLFFDGFETLTNAQDVRKWATATGGSHSTGRVTGNAATFDSSSSTYQYETFPFTAAANWAVAFGIYITAHSGASTFFQVKDGASTVHLYLKMNASRRIELYRGDNTLLATSTTVLALTTWYSVQLRFIIHDSTGAYNLIINSASEATATGQDTRNGGNATIDRLQLIQADATTHQFRIDDFACGTSNDTDMTHDSFGDVHVYTSVPNANGATNNWTPSTTNYQDVDDTTPDDDSSYVASQNPGDDDLYGFTDLTLTGTILCVGLQLCHRIDDTGSRTMKGLCRSGGSTTEQGSTITPTTSYGVTQVLIPQDPNTSAAWTQTNLNSAQFGARLKT